MTIKKCPDCRGSGIRIMKWKELKQVVDFPALVDQQDPEAEVSVVCRTCRRNGISTGYVILERKR